MAYLGGPTLQGHSIERGVWRKGLEGELILFSFLPPHKKLVREKVTPLYSGFGYDQIVKMV